MKRQSQLLWMISMHGKEGIIKSCSIHMSRHGALMTPLPVYISNIFISDIGRALRVFHHSECIPSYQSGSMGYS
jgi:hypothetical protein